MSKSGKWKEALTCPVCGKAIKTSDTTHQRGRIQEGDPVGHGGVLGINIVNLFYNKTFKKHPFYLASTAPCDNDRNGIEAHHLVTSASLKQDGKYQRLAFFLGYNINHSKNGVLLPTIMKVACHYGVPLHKGGHGATFIKKESKRDIDTLPGMFKGLDEWNHKFNKNEVTIFSVHDEANELTDRRYQTHVNKLVANCCKIYTEEMDICKKTKEEIEEIAINFINAMDKLSQALFRELISFAWVLTSDGFDYKANNIGCCEQDYLYEKRNLFKKADPSLATMKAREMMYNIYSDPQKAKDIKEKLLNKCIAGSNQHATIITNNNQNYFLERKKLQPFKFE